MESVSPFKKLVEQLKDQCDIFTFYIAEAHATDGWSFAFNNYKIANHTCVEDRIEAAKQLQELELGCSIICDDIKDEISTKFHAHPERLYIIKDGVVVWRCGQGPFGYDMKGCIEFLESILGQQ